MYPLTAVLIGYNETDYPEVRHELAEQGIKVEAEYGNVNQAIASLTQSASRPHLFLFQVQSAAECQQLARLNDAFLGRPVVALVSGPNAPDMVLQAMRSGAAQVVTLPVQPEDFKQALDRIARQFGYAGNVSRVIAVSGASEGCGVTTLAINLSAEIASQFQMPTLLMELSLRLGRLTNYLDIEPRFTSHDLLSDMERLDIDVVRQALVKVADNFHVLAGPSKGIPTLKVTPDQVVRLIEYGRRLASVVVLDMPYTFDDVYFHALAAAEQVVLVAEPNVPSLQALETLHQTLQQTEGIGSLYLVLNRHDPRDKDFTIEGLQEMLKVPRIFPVANDWAHCVGALNSGHVLRVEGKRGPALADIDALAEALLGRAPLKKPSHWHMPNFLRRMMSTAMS